MAFPVLFVYYAVITLLSIVLINNIDQLRLPDSMSQLAGYIGSTSFAEQRKNGGGNYTESLFSLYSRLKQYYLYENKHTTQFFNFLKPQLAKVKELAAPLVAPADHIWEALLGNWLVAQQLFDDNVTATLNPHYVKASGFLSPYLDHIKSIVEPYYKETLLYVSKTQHLLTTRVHQWYHEYLAVHLNQIVDAYSPFFSDLYEIYDSRISPLVEHHKDTIALGGIIIAVAVLHRTISGLVTSILKAFARDAHDLNESVNMMYRANTEDLTRTFGKPEFEVMNDESGGLDDGISEQENASPRTPTQNPSSKASSVPATPRQGSTGSNRTGSNRTGSNRTQQHTIVFNEQQEQESQKKDFSYEEEEDTHKSVKEILIGSEIYEVTSDILSSTTQDPKSLRSNHIIITNQSTQIRPNNYSLEEAEEEEGDEAASEDGAVHSSDELDSLTESSQLASISYDVRAESINRILNSPLRMAQSAASNASMRSNSQNKIGLLPPNLAVSSSPALATTTINELNVYTNDQVFEATASSVQYLSDISNGRISPKSGSSGTFDSDVSNFVQL